MGSQPWLRQFPSCAEDFKKGIVHISFLAWDAAAYHGKGMFVADAIMLLETLAPATLMAKVLEVKPRAGAKLSAFGWCPDGNIANSAISFAMTSLVAFAVVHTHVLPTPLIHALAHIDVVYKKHNHVLPTPHIHALAHRTGPGMTPFFLATEFARNAMGQEPVNAIVKQT